MALASRTRLKLLAGLLIVGLIWAGWAWHSAKKEVAATEVHPVQGLTVNYILTPERCAALGDVPGQEFDVEPNGAVLISNQDGLLEAMPTNGGLRVDRIAEKAPDSFSLDGQGTLLSISQQYFGQLENNQFSQAVPLPFKGMKLSGSSLPEVTYVFGGEGGNSQRVYAFFADGTLQIEAEVPEAVIAVADNHTAVYIASSRSVFRVTAKRIDTVARIPDDFGNIVSIAISPDEKTLYFSTDNETFVMSGLSAVSLLRDLGGMLRFRNGKLHVWSPSRRILVSVNGLEGVLESLRKG